jgi:predicted nucleotidyltransferase
MAGVTSMDAAAIDDPVLKEITVRLVQAYEPECVYLFGSKARDEDHPDSDYDLMVIVTEDTPPHRQRSKLAYECLWGVRAAADVLVWTREAFDRKRHLKSSLPGTILREGKILYAS